MQLQPIYEFIRQHRLAVISTTSPEGEPQSALVGIAVSPQLQIVFDTLRSSRKYRNLTADPRISLVVGWEDEITVQYQGIAVEPQGQALRESRDLYLEVWPDGVERHRTPETALFRIEPAWIRFSDFRSGRIEEESFASQSLTSTPPPPSTRD
jgi:general stress protein 26